MPTIEFPYGKETLPFTIPESRFKGELVSCMHRYRADKSQEDLVRDALANPIGTPRLSVMAEGKKRVVLIASDHTRPVPSRIIVPLMLSEIRRGSPDADITILIATGCHRDTTREELEAKFGPALMRDERIVLHNCDSPETAYLGRLPSGGGLVVNRLAMEADLLVAEGFIEPHFFAGFSGGRKSVLPGIAGRKTVVYNHNAEFIAHPRARTGILDGNPIHIDMLYAARCARLAFICNVVINSQKEVIYASAGDCDLAHRAGAAFLSDKCRVEAGPAGGRADIAIVTNGGYPLDQNIYQAVKGMTAAEAAVRKGGVIIMLAKSGDGHGAPEFYKTFAEEKNLDRMLDTFMKTPRESTRVDQWQSQIFARVLKHAALIYMSDAPDEMVRDLHMTPAHSIEEAVKTAERMLGTGSASITAIPDGVAVMVTE
ncbi:MAG: nickel-dependent lactate racemase [Treponema sp.]|jgi:nickel-dependent lactate racemase|nr:nickel-dependent lactate racemase [Treponema sp.]